MGMMKNKNVKQIKDGLDYITFENSWSYLLLNTKDPYISSIQNFDKSNG